MQDLPHFWKSWLDESWDKIRNESISIIDQNTLNKIISLSLIVKVPQDLSANLHTQLKAIIPPLLHDKILFQPLEGYHLTLQWAPENEAVNLNKEQFAQELGVFLKDYFPIKGTILFPFFGPAGLGFLLQTETNQEFLNIRRGLSAIWEKHSLTTGYKNDWELAFGSMTRYSQHLTDNEKQSLHKIEFQVFPEVVLTEVALVLNDKFADPKITKELATFKF